MSQENKIANQISTRLTPEMMARFKVVADRRFHGNEAMATREAISIYLDLRNTLGYDFDREIERLLSDKREPAVA